MFVQRRKSTGKRGCEGVYRAGGVCAYFFRLSPRTAGGRDLPAPPPAHFRREKNCLVETLNTALSTPLRWRITELRGCDISWGLLLLYMNCSMSPQGFLYTQNERNTESTVERRCTNFNDHRDCNVYPGMRLHKNMENLVGRCARGVGVPTTCGG